MARPTLTAEQRSQQDRRQHRQLLQGMAASVAEKGYWGTTIADAVRHARVSKSTFYAHFDDKEQCYVALYSAASNNVLDAMRDADAAAATTSAPWREHLDAVNRAYLRQLASGGGLTRSLLVEVQTAGPSAVEMRRDVISRYVDLMLGVCNALARNEPTLRPISAQIALGVVGGVNEVVMAAIESGPVERLTDLVELATHLWAAHLAAASVHGV
jgi:AcrR family transcriptional regulator